MDTGEMIVAEIFSQMQKDTNHNFKNLREPQAE